MIKTGGNYSGRLFPTTVSLRQWDYGSGQYFYLASGALKRRRLLSPAVDGVARECRSLFFCDAGVACVFLHLLLSKDVRVCVPRMGFFCCELMRRSPLEVDYVSWFFDTAPALGSIVAFRS